MLLWQQMFFTLVLMIWGFFQPVHTQLAAAVKFCFGNDFSVGGCRLPSFRWPVGLRHLRAGGLFSLTPGAASLPNGLTHLHLGDRCN